MLTNYPASIVVHGVALNITVQSYDQSLDFGLIADAAAAPDVQALANAIGVAMEDLRALPRHEAQPAPAAGGLMGTARKLARNVAGAVAQQAMQGAMHGAVQAVTGAARLAKARAGAPMDARLRARK
jgi:hypothetical protein